MMGIFQQAFLQKTTAKNIALSNLSGDKFNKAVTVIL